VLLRQGPKWSRMTSIEGVQTLRIEPTDAVACEVGFEDPAVFRRLFKRPTGVTPDRCRQRFARIARRA
jgi:AraC-like DNA-binding protein